MKIDFDFTIKNKFYILLGTTLFLSLLSVLLISVRVNNMHNNEQFSDSLITFKSSFSELEISEKLLILNLREDPDFYISGKSDLIDNYKKKYAQINVIYNQIKSNDLVDDIANNKEFNNIKEQIKEYNENTESLIKSVKNLGNINYGLENQLQVAYLSVFELNDNQEINPMLIDIYRSAINYSLYNEKIHYDKFIKKYNDLLEFIESTEISVEDSISVFDFGNELLVEDTASLDFLLDMPSDASTNTDIKLALNEYKSLFDVYVISKEELGLSNTEGIRGKIQNNVKNINNAILNSIMYAKEDNFGKYTVTIILIIIFSIIIITILSVGILYLLVSIVTPINKLDKYLFALKSGELPDKKLFLNNKDELLSLIRSLNSLIDSLKKATMFAIAIGKGDFSSKFVPTSDGDVLGNSLLEMRNSLQNAKEEETKRKEEDNKRNWATQGITKFNDILRQNSENIEDLGYKIISNLVEYLSANQGGLFLCGDDTQEEDASIELIASYAYNRRKYQEKRIIPGEGLIGTCAVEKQTIHLTQIPENYINITSGLGEATPKSLIIVPLKSEDNIMGIIEIASFNTFGKHEVDFIEELAEDIAMTLSSAKISQRTNDLLNEFKQQSEAMAAQEEEMRQNLEELQATQEASSAKEMELEGLLSAIDHTTMRIEFKTDGTIISVNDKYLNTFGYSFEDLNNQDIRNYIEDEEQEEFEKMWQQVKNGYHKEQISESKTKAGISLWLLTSYSPIKDYAGSIYKIVFLANDITAQKISK